LTLAMAPLAQHSGRALAEPVLPLSAARVERLENFGSRHVDAREVDVWLPAGYGGGARYDVIYMQDGQMLFDASTTWNKKSWDAGTTMTRLIGDGAVPGTIIVAVWNGGAHRHSEYYPTKMLALIPEPQRTHFLATALGGISRSDEYLRFLVEELKPYIDSHYATLPAREHNFVMGSSMGGLISIYALCEYPDVFGGAAALSTHWIGSFEPNAWAPLAAFDYLRANLPDPRDHRLYMDHGTRGLDALYGTAQAVIDQIVLDHGFTAANWQSRVFEGADHNEDDWAKRLEIPVRFLLAPAAELK
jgi:predicted alpha/beta superfamily hydrolase